MVTTRLWPALLAVGLAATAGRGQYLEATIRVNHRPSLILWTPTSNKVYVASTYDENVLVIDAANLRVTAGIQLADQPSSMCWNSVSNKLYVATGENDQVTVIDCVSDTALAVLHVAGRPSPMAFNPVLNKLYVGSLDNGMLSVFDGAGDSLLRRVQVASSYVQALLYHRCSDRVLCAVRADDQVKTIDCSTDEVVAELPTSPSPRQLVAGATDSIVYVICYRAVNAIAAAGDSVVATVDAPLGGASAVPYPNKLYGANSGSKAIFVLDCRWHTVTDSIPSVVWQLQAVCDTIGNRVYAVGLMEDSVLVIDPWQDSVLSRLPLGRCPEALTWDWLDNRIFVANGMDTTVSVIRTNVGIQEEPRSLAVRHDRAASVTRGMLEWRAALEGRLLDLSGRVVANLEPGMNRLAGVAPGVYFAMCADGTQAVRVAVVQ